MFEINIDMFSRQAINGLVDKIAILGMNVLKDPLQRNVKAEGFVPVDSKYLLRPNDFFGREVVCKTAGVVQRLSSSQVSLPAAQCFFYGFALRNINDNG